MNSRNFRKFAALSLSATLAFSGSMTVFADGTESTGTSAGHADREVITVDLPTNNTTIFNYKVDPEGLIKAAGKLVDGTAITGNNDGVYFTNAGASATAGSVSAYSIDGESSGYTVTVNDLSKNDTYTYDGSDWKNGAGETASVTISATKTADGSTVSFGNNDSVTVSGAVAAGAGSYSSTSDAATFAGKNSVDVEVSVAAAVTATDAEKDIALVADEASLEAATGPALLLEMTVGTDKKAITSDGATAKATIAGKPDNFEVKPNAGGTAYEYVAKGDASGWDSKTLTMHGKTNDKDVAADTTVPKVTLTWTTAKATNSSSSTANGYGYFSGDNSKVWLDISSSANGGITDATKVTSVKLAGADVAYEVSSNWILVTWQQMKDAGATWDAAGTYSFTYTYDGTTYTTSVTPRS